MTTIAFQAPDISCGHCKASIESDLAGEPGVRSVVVDVDARQVRIDFEEQETDPDTLRSKLTEAGYPPS